MSVVAEGILPTDIGRLPAALALNLGLPLDLAGVFAGRSPRVGDPKSCGVEEPLELDDEDLTLDPLSEVAEVCELAFLGSTGRRLAAPVATTNLFPCTFFFGGEAVGSRISSAGVTVLPDEAVSLSLSSSSSDGWGETKRAVGRGPDDEGPLGFFRIGCGGGGFAALEERSLNLAPVSFKAVSLWGWAGVFSFSRITMARRTNGGTYYRQTRSKIFPARNDLHRLLPTCLEALLDAQR